MLASSECAGYMSPPLVAFAGRGTECQQGDMRVIGIGCAGQQRTHAVHVHDQTLHTQDCVDSISKAPKLSAKAAACPEAPLDLRKIQGALELAPPHPGMLL